MSDQSDAIRRAQGKLQEDIAEDAMQSIGKAAKGVWDYFTSPDDTEFLRRVDKRHGTNLGELHARIKAGPGADLQAERAIDRMIACTVCGKVHLDACAAEDLAADGEVLIVVEEDAPKPCGFCKGKQVIQIKATVRTAIKCPTCGKNPAAKPKALGK